MGGDGFKSPTKIPSILIGSGQHHYLHETSLDFDWLAPRGCHFPVLLGPGGATFQKTSMGRGAFLTLLTWPNKALIGWKGVGGSDWLNWDVGVSDWL